MSSHAEVPGAEAVDAALLRELQGLHDQLLGQGKDDTAPMLAVARLVHGVNLQDWGKLRHVMSLHGWCALEMCAQDGKLCPPQLADCDDCRKGGDPVVAGLRATPLLQQLHKEVARADRGQSPLSLAIFGLTPQWPATDDQSRQAARVVLMEAIRRHTLSCDSLGQLEKDRLVLILPGAGLFKAQAVVEEVLGDCACTEGLQWAAGIAGGTVGGIGGGTAGGIGGDGQTLLQQALQALRDAQQQQLPVRVHREAAHPLSERKTLVHSDEKRFLFSGGDK